MDMDHWPGFPPSQAQRNGSGEEEQQPDFFLQVTCRGLSKKRQATLSAKPLKIRMYNSVHVATLQQPGCTATLQCYGGVRRPLGLHGVSTVFGHTCTQPRDFKNKIKIIQIVYLVHS